jgi:hypothetical protein
VGAQAQVGSQQRAGPCGSGPGQGRDAANAKLEIAADGAKAYVSVFGMLLEGEDVEEQAPAVREQFASILRSPPTAPLSHDPARFRFPA